MAECTVDGCDEPGVVKLMCRKHYMRQLRKGSTADKRKNARKECIEIGCGGLAAAHGLCDMHYRRTRHQAVEHHGRSCVRCAELIPARRKSSAKYCSAECKYAATQPARSRRYQLRVKYGITDAGFDELLAAQGGCCAVCRTANPPGRGQRLHVDHDHATGKVRGLLCTECNVGLGKFKDDPELLRRAAEYLVVAAVM